MNIEQLMHEHDLIDEHTLALERACEAVSPDIDQVLTTRDALRTILEDHLSHEDEALFGKLMTANHESAAAVESFTADFADLRADWSLYLSDWSGEWLTTDWPGFQRETAALMRRIRERTGRETGLLYPLALKSGAVALRAA